jgi:uroporphyrinogen-III decarboxylase
MILSFGGGISPGTLPENIDALLEATRGWRYA